ncbi:MMPL family transporter [Bacteriovoracaceae bacterium]|nr:MMPL family transporter [Bacteriovoracaceae bacterium]
MIEKSLIKIQEYLIRFSINHPKKIMVGGGIITLIFLSSFPRIVTDTDPVHMLPQDNEAVVLHNKVKKEFNLSDIVALGIQNRSGNSLFTPSTLGIVKKITDEILLIRDEDGSEIFENIDLISISTIDDIITNDQGELLVTKLMKNVPKNQEDANEILKRLNDNPIVGGKVASRDGSLLGIFIPLKEGKKDRSYYLSQKIKSISEKHLTKEENYYFAGLPVAETTFGHEMFIQMAIYAPMAGLVIFLLLLMFFKSFKVVLAPMILAMMAVIWSMGTLIYSGNVIHIMSSMIPIFIMPIAVLDSVHILSVLSEKIGSGLSRQDAIKEVVSNLFNPMFYTSLTTVVGFMSLSTTGIPPVVVFGVIIAFGVAISFLLTIIFIPAYTMLLSEETLKKFGHVPKEDSPINKLVKLFKNISWNNANAILISSLIIIVVSVFGIKNIIINDNPVRWFKKEHPLRIADVQMNKSLAGTYMTNLVFQFPESKNGDEEDDFSEEEIVDNISIRHPKVMSYIERVGIFLNSIRKDDGTVIIGGTTSVADVLKKIGKVAFNTDKLPDTREKISQYMFLFESGDLKKGRDLWKLVENGTSKKSQMWVHFKSGDNQNMTFVRNALTKYMTEHPAPVIDGVKLEIKWSGLMHINNIWQAEMVSGMRDALMGSFIIVFFMMTILFRSIKWAVVAMLPLSITILFIYGAIGFAGKFYDMPIAILSSLTLGLSIDFAIHFIEHARTYNLKYKDHAKTFEKLFSGTAQAIWRNVMVISIGFTPLFFAALQPYFTVGMFFFLIMIISGVTTLLLMPAIIRKFHSKLSGFNDKGMC